MKRIVENDSEASEFFDALDEVKYDNSISLNQAKMIYNNIKSDDINMVVKPNDAWMIEVF